MTELYNLHTDGDQYRVTKFIDGNVEASYLVSHGECQCPVGPRPSCRHRQMLPAMLNAGILNTHWFWSRDLNQAVDLNGNIFDPVPTHTPAPAPEGQHSVPAPATSASPAQGWRRL